VQIPYQLFDARVLRYVTEIDSPGGTEELYADNRPIRRIIDDSRIIDRRNLGHISLLKLDVKGVGSLRVSDQLSSSHATVVT
jgi:hypothetical protein